MQAVILAAGKGTRLRPLTDKVPKPMIPVGGKPILEYTLNILPKDVDEALIIVGYMGDTLRDYFGPVFTRTNGKQDIALTYVRQEEQKGTGHALQIVRPFLKKGRFFLLNSDDLYHPEDFSKALLKNDPVVLVKRSETPERFGVCTVDEKGQLQGILEKRPNPPTNLVNIGAYLLEHDVFDEPVPVLPNGELNLAEQIGNWAKKRPVYTLEATFWYPVNTVDELAVAEKVIKNMRDEHEQP